jgi:hypothetical protein
MQTIIQHVDGSLVGPVAAAIAVVGFVALIVFQCLLASGAPLGHLAWGGAHRRLPPGLRVASALAAGFLAFGVVCLLERVGMVHVVGDAAVVRWTVWSLVALFALSLVANLASRSAAERRMGIPLTLVLTAACAVVAAS